jgi:hypothetical protein
MLLFSSNLILCCFFNRTVDQFDIAHRRLVTWAIATLENAYIAARP